MENGYSNYFVYIIAKLRHYAEGKALVGFVVSTATFFFDPAHYLAMLALFMLIIIDFFFGIAASRHTGDPIRSAKIIRSAIKMVVYFALVAAARVTEHAIPISMLDETVTGFLAATELISILENTGRMGYAVPQKVVQLLGDFVGGKNKENAARFSNHHKK